MDYFLIDGYNMCFRAFYAMPELTRSDGFPTGALHAFFAGIIKLSSMDVPHATAIFFDQGGSARHREIYPEYKANRDAMPDAMRMQIEPIRELCSLLGFFVKSQNGIEAFCERLENFNRKRGQRLRPAHTPRDTPAASAA